MSIGSLPKVNTPLNKHLLLRWKRDRARIVQLEESEAEANLALITSEQEVTKLKATVRKFREEKKDLKQVEDTPQADVEKEKTDGVSSA